MVNNRDNVRDITSEDSDYAAGEGKAKYHKDAIASIFWVNCLRMPVVSSLHSAREEEVFTNERFELDTGNVRVLRTQNINVPGTEEGQKSGKGKLPDQ
ncbi:hypothetical protein OPT61_g2451 [Boeremia exigua]|uniref:Uncharacterized protein n=1 Tax=Boeremia exigua TaxID=749465 RepID=A0ACC2ILG3_9PLEO|nr:hypothetical protein OPT61_g2451 [Boeremia exigua]